MSGSMFDLDKGILLSGNCKDSNNNWRLLLSDLLMDMDRLINMICWNKDIVYWGSGMDSNNI